MATPLSLLEALAQVPDPRKKKGLRHPLSAVLSLAVLAMLTGAKSYEAIAQFGRDKGAPLAHALGFRRGKTPCKSCLSELFRALDVVAFEAALASWVLARLPRAEGRTLAIDGKAVRGSRDGEAPGQHLVAAYDGDAAAVLGQLRVDSKTNEHKAALALLGILPVEGNVVTGDAAFCQRDLCGEVIRRGGHYVLVVKDNQPSLATDIRAGLAAGDQARRLAAACPPYGPVPEPPPGTVARTVDKAHGRKEVRSIRTTAVLTKGQDWNGLRQGFEVTRERTVAGERAVEVVYGITSLPPERADASRLLARVRGHWGIENGLHYRRDVTLGEDASRVREGSAPQVMAALRNALIHLVQPLGAPSLAAAIRECGNRFPQALMLLGIPPLQ